MSDVVDGASPDEIADARDELARLRIRLENDIVTSQAKWDVSNVSSDSGFSELDPRRFVYQVLELLASVNTLLSQVPESLTDVALQFLRRVALGPMVLVPETASAEMLTAARSVAAACLRFLTDCEAAINQFVWNDRETYEWGSSISELRTSASRLIGILDEVGRLSAAEEAAEVAVAAAEQATEAAASLTDKANQVGTESLSEHFTEFARREQRRAVVSQAITTVLVLMVVGVSLDLTLLQKTPSSWSTESVFKLTLSLPLLALAYYFAREASHHAAAARRAREIDVRLRTIRQYTVELPESDRIAIRAEFARSLFTANWGTEYLKDVNALGKEMSDLARALSAAVAGMASGGKDAKA